MLSDKPLNSRFANCEMEFYGCTNQSVVEPTLLSLGRFPNTSAHRTVCNSKWRVLTICPVNPPFILFSHVSLRFQMSLCLSNTHIRVSLIIGLSTHRSLYPLSSVGFPVDLFNSFNDIYLFFPTASENRKWSAYTMMADKLAKYHLTYIIELQCMAEITKNTINSNHNKKWI